MIGGLEEALDQIMRNRAKYRRELLTLGFLAVLENTLNLHKQDKVTSHGHPVNA